MHSDGHLGRIGSGVVVALGIVGVGIVLLEGCQVMGWDPTWRAFGVTPLQPPFFDMHVINDYAACASRGVDAYAPHACNVDNFNIPPVWLWLGLFGLDGSDSAWLSAILIVITAIVMVLLFRGRRWQYGVLGLAAIVSPSVMMGVERGNLDLLILAFVGLAALFYKESKPGSAFVAIALLSCGIALKLFPMFCVSLANRFSRQTFIFACATAALSLTYLGVIIHYVFLIQRNVPTTFILSYGYKAIFLGLDHLRSEAGLSPTGLADTWLPAATAGVVLICAATLAGTAFRYGREFCCVEVSAAGNAFLFGAGIYCGTYLLGTNFIYRLMFLLLCIPQLLDWQIRILERDKRGRLAELSLFGAVLGVLWLNGNANGHTSFLLLPQLLDWLLFFCLAAVLMLNLLRTSVGSARARRVGQNAVEVTAAGCS
jgi:hypothetical protein